MLLLAFVAGACSDSDSSFFQADKVPPDPELVNALPDMRIPDIHTVMAECMQRTKKNLDAQGWKPAPRGQ